MYLHTSLTDDILAMPMIDCHNHCSFPRVWNWFDGDTKKSYTSTVAEALTDLDGVDIFTSAGLTGKEQHDIRCGLLDRRESLRTLLRYMDDAKASHHVQFVRKGLEICYGVPIDKWDLGTLLTVDSAADRTYGADGWRDFAVLYDRGNMKRVMLNQWNTLGISYYGPYLQTITPEELAADRRCNARIATFDYYSTPPFSERTHRFAALCGADYESFDEYETFLEKLADFYVNRMDVVGFKFSEAYFRALDYRPVSREDAKKAYKPDMTAEEKRTLSDWVSRKILDLARSYRIPAQFHTGVLWGSSNMAMINPLNLEPTIRDFPDLRFDLLHCGYPFTAETGVLCNTYRNVYVNINPMLRRSFEHTKQWLDVYLNLTSTNHLLFGMDTFTPEAAIGGCYFVRVLIAELMETNVARGTLTVSDARETAEKLLHVNAERLYGV